METTYFDEMIGQDKTKRVLSFYIDAFEKNVPV